MTSAYRFPDYQVAGGDADTTIFLLHGAYGSKDYYRYEIETLARAGYRVVAWDAPGYGISPLPEGGLNIERMVALFCLPLIFISLLSANAGSVNNLVAISSPITAILVP